MKTARLTSIALLLIGSLHAHPAMAGPEAPRPDSAAAVPTPSADAPAPATASPPAIPLLLDPLDLGFGSSVVFGRIPTPRDLSDLGYVLNVNHVVLALPEWPPGWEQLQALQNAPLPEGADLVVLLPGYPPSRQAAQAWNYLRKPLRIVMLVNGPPADRGDILELNAIRGLERVIADMADPSRSGFERLQRPLSFRVVRP